MRTAAIDWTAVVKGALVEMILIIPTAIIVAAATNGDTLTTSNLWFVALAVIVVAPLVAGLVAARGHGEAPLVHGALGAAVGYAGVIVVNIAKRAADGKSFSASLVVAILLFLCIAITLGMTGAYVTFRWELRQRREDTGS